MSVVTGVAIAAASILTIHRLLTNVRLFRDLFLDCPPSVISFLYMPFVIPSILYELVVSLSKGSVPECNDEILLLSGSEMSRRIKSGELTSLRIVNAAIRRLEQVNPQINAIVTFRFEQARSHARTIDRLLRQRDPSMMKSPLAGVPCVVKECMEMPGMPYTAGVKSRMNTVGSNYATCVRRALDAGIIILGGTNTSEACMFHESNNTIYGLTRNPYDLSRTVGGSSGGCAAAVASCICPIAITSDVGGSTRIPCLYTGLYGHKASGGSVPNTGTFPHCSGLISRYCQIGPTVRDPQDLYPLMNILYGPDHLDNQTRCKREIQLHPPQSYSLESKNIVVYDLNECFQSCLKGCSRYHPEMKRAHKNIVKNLLRSFKNSKHVVLSVKNDLPELSEAFDIWASMLDDARSQTFLETISSKGDHVLTTCEALTELLKCVLRCNRTCRNGTYDHTLPAVGLGILEQTVRLVPSRAQRLVKCGERLRRRLNALLGDYGILVVPSLLCPAPRHHENILRIMSSGQTGIFNVTQLPATAIPSKHLSKYGLPMGVQIVASEQNDWLCLEAARLLSKSKQQY